MKMKILMSLSTIGIAAAPIAATISCGSDTTDNTKIKNIAMIISTRNNPYFVTVEDSAKKEAKKYGYNLKTFVSEDKQDVEMDKIDIIIAEGFKVLILNGIDAQQSAVAAKKAIKAGIEVIAFDRKLDASAGDIWTTISSLNKEGARDLAKKTIALFKKSKIASFDLLHLQGVSGESNGIDRWNGVQLSLNEEGNTTKPVEIYESRADYNRKKGQDQTATKMTAHTNIKWINADNDGMALGAIASQGDKVGIDPKTKIIVTGFDGIKDAIDAVKAGTMFGTVKQDAILMGAKAVQSAIEALGGKDFSDIEKGKDIKVPVFVITNDNVDEYM